MDVIEKDLNRMYADLGFFKKGGCLYQPIKNILFSFAIYRAELGYVQGMSYVCANLLLHLGDELRTFISFLNLMHSPQMMIFYTFNMK